jgi:hypothetical protein
MNVNSEGRQLYDSAWFGFWKVLVSRLFEKSEIPQFLTVKRTALAVALPGSVVKVTHMMAINSGGESLELAFTLRLSYLAVEYVCMFKFPLPLLCLLLFFLAAFSRGLQVHLTLPRLAHRTLLSCIEIWT